MSSLREILSLQGWWGTVVPGFGAGWLMSSALGAPVNGKKCSSHSGLLIKITIHDLAWQSKITPSDLCQSCWFTSSWWALIRLQNALPGQKAIAHQNNWAPLRLNGSDACWRWGMSRVRSSLLLAWSWQERITMDTPVQLCALFPEGTASPALALQLLTCCEGSQFQFALEWTVLNQFLPPMKILFSRQREGKK